jgi:hypothetical protein
LFRFSVNRRSSALPDHPPRSRFCLAWLAESFADAPQPARDTHIMGDRLGSHFATSNIKSAGYSRDLRRGREINGGSRPLFGTGQKGKVLHEQPKQRRQPIEVVPEPGSGRAGGETIGGNGRAGETPAQLEREEDVFQLRAKIGAEELMPLLALQVVEIERGAVGSRSYRDNASGRRRTDAIEQKIRQQERRQMIDRKGLLDPLGGQFAARKYSAGIVNQHIDLRICVLDSLREAANFALR